MSQSTTTHPKVAPSPTLPHARRKGGRFSIRLFPIVASTEKKQLVSAKALPPSRAGEGWGGAGWPWAMGASASALKRRHSPSKFRNQSYCVQPR